MIQGIQRGVWSKELLDIFPDEGKKLSPKSVSDAVIRYVRFSDLSRPTSITKSEKIMEPSSTEAKIKDLLFYLDYQFQHSLIINGFEVDFLIGKSLILEYNGFHHYYTNHDPLKLTLRDIWKREILKKRGFLFCCISFQ